MANFNYHHLRYFRAVAHDGNLTRTASRLNVSQSALSTQIRHLEERLGHALFERKGRELHLTEAGRIALDHADQIFSTGEELLEVLKQESRPQQAIRIGALATLSRNFQTAFVRPILGRADVEVILRSGSTPDLVDGLETLNFDLVLLNQPLSRETGKPYVSHRLAEQQVVLVGSPQRILPDRTLPVLLSENPLILPTPESGIRTAFDALADRLGVRPQIAAEADDMAMMRLLAREGIGLAVLPPIVVKDELENGLLVEASTPLGIAEMFYAVTIERRFPNPLIRELLPADEGGAEQNLSVTKL